MESEFESEKHYRRRFLRQIAGTVVAMFIAGRSTGSDNRALADSSLVARRLCGMPIYLVAAPAYLSAHGRPRHPMNLAEHPCIGYGHGIAPDAWRFTHKNGKTATVRPSGPLRVNNGDAMMPVLIAGTGLGVLPADHEFAAGVEVHHITGEDSRVDHIADLAGLGVRAGLFRLVLLEEH